MICYTSCLKPLTMFELTMCCYMTPTAYGRTHLSSKYIRGPYKYDRKGNDHKRHHHIHKD